LPSYQHFDESQVNEDVFYWKYGSLIHTDDTKLVLMDIGAHLCVSFVSSSYWAVSRIRSLPELTGRMWSDVMSPKGSCSDKTFELLQTGGWCRLEAERVTEGSPCLTSWRTEPN